MNVNFKFQNENYTLEYDLINLSKACQIDYDSYYKDDSFTNLEWKSILNNVNFTIHKNGILFFNSQNNNPDNLDFRLCKIVLEFIQNNLGMKEKDVSEFTKNCKLFIDKKTTKIPPELIIAENILLNRMFLTLQDIENMPVTKYEKINIALNLLNEKSK